MLPEFTVEQLEDLRNDVLAMIFHNLATAEGLDDIDNCNDVALDIANSVMTKLVCRARPDLLETWQKVDADD
jgi:hypothetical protein